MDVLVCRVRNLREAQGLKPSELAARSGLSRQGLHKIERGEQVPSTLVALRLAAALGSRVEDLFSAGPAPLSARLLHEAEVGDRVQLAEVDGVLHAYLLEGAAGLGTSADGVITALEGKTATVQAFSDARLIAESAVLAGCDPSLGLVAARSGARVLWRAGSSAQALAWLAAGAVHAAGIHLYDARSGQSNAPFVRQALPGVGVRLITLWSWQQGLLVAPGNPLNIQGAADLGRNDVRLVNREAGAGSRLLLDGWLQAAGLRGAALSGYGREVGSHQAVAECVARGEADAGPGPMSVARALGLDFVPLQRERFDLVVPECHLNHPGVRALLASLTRPELAQELGALGGYDSSGCGTLWQTLNGSRP